MRVLLYLLIVLPVLGISQELKILSSKDKTPVSYGIIIIKNNLISFNATTNADGIAKIERDFKDTSSYILRVRAVGFSPYTRTLNGNELNILKTIYIKPDSIQLGEVVITAQYAPTKAEASVQKIQIIDRQKIDQMGAVNLRDVLTNQMNVRLQQDNVLGCSLSSQGISGENVKILIDGVPVIGRLNGNVDLSQINLNNIERIEMIEGPLSVQYGTNALAGTINLITKKNSYCKYNAGLTTYYESIGAYNIVGDVSLSRGKHLFQVSGGRNYFDGWNKTDGQFELPKERIADSARYKQWKPKEQYFADFSYNYNFTNSTIGVKSAYFDEKIINRGYPRQPYGESTFDDYYYTKRIDNAILANGKISNRWNVQSVSAYNYYNRIKRTVYKDLTTLEEKLSANSSDQDTTGFTLLMSRSSFSYHKDSSKVNFELGYDVNYESALGKRIDDRIQAMGDFAMFSTMEYRPFKKLVLKPGVRYSYNTVYTAPLVPSINVKWSLTPKQSIRASYAMGFRAPSIKELYFYFVDINHNIIGNRVLKSETSNNYMLSYNLILPKEKIVYKLDVSTFYNDITNLITLAQVSGTQYSYVNIGHYKTTGVQVTNGITYKRVSVQIGANYTGRYNDLSQSEQVPQFSYSPELQSNLSYKFLKAKTVVSLFYKYNGKLPSYTLIDDKVQQSFIDHYQMLDATIDKQFLKDKLRITIGCKNVLDVTNIKSNISGGVHSGSTTSVALATGRNYFVKLSLNFHQFN